MIRCPTQTGSNLAGEPILHHRSEQLAKEQQVFDALTARYETKARHLLRASEFQAAGELVEAAKARYRAGILDAAGDADQLAGLKAETSKGLKQRLADSIAPYRALKALQQEHADYDVIECKAVRARVWAQAPRGDGPGVLPPQPDAIVTAPFPLQDVGQSAAPQPWSAANVYDDSWVLAAGGYITNAFRYVHSHSDARLTMDGYFSLKRSGSLTTWAGLGIVFNMPRAGRPQVHFSMKNLHNRVVLSLIDRFGFSGGHLNVDAGLFIDLVRADGDVTHVMAKQLLVKDMRSVGQRSTT